jgi:redox-sensitive bicupin YhaK (pirin superfamily)
LKHQDSTGGEMTLSSGEIQVMTAGTKIAHSEMNASEIDPVTLLQIWVLPDTLNLTPGYQQKRFEFQKDQWNLIVSPDGQGESLTIHQQSWFSILESDSSDQIIYVKHSSESLIYIFVIKGLVEVVGFENILNYRDALGIVGGEVIDFKLKKPSKVLVIEVPR